MSHIPTGECWACGYRKRVNQKGTLYNHTHPVGDGVRFRCIGSLGFPVLDSVRVTEDPPDVPHIFDLVTGAGVVPDQHWTDRYYWVIVAVAAVLAVVGGALLAYFGSR